MSLIYTFLCKACLSLSSVALFCGDQVRVVIFTPADDWSVARPPAFHPSKPPLFPAVPTSTACVILTSLRCEKRTLTQGEKGTCVFLFSSIIPLVFVTYSGLVVSVSDEHVSTRLIAHFQTASSKMMSSDLHCNNETPYQLVIEIWTKKRRLPPPWS